MSMIYRYGASVNNKDCLVVGFTALLSSIFSYQCVGLYYLGKKHVLTTTSKPVDPIQHREALKETKENKPEMNRVRCLGHMLNISI